MRKMTIEGEEMAALYLISKGQGRHEMPPSSPLASQYDEVVVTFVKQDPTLVGVYLRKGGKTKRSYAYRLTAIDRK